MGRPLLMVREPGKAGREVKMKPLFKSSTILALVLASVLLTGCGGKDVQGGNEGESQRNENAIGQNREDASSNEDVSSNVDGSAEGQDNGDDAENYPVIETADYSDVALETAENSQFSCSYPADGWMAMAGNPIQIYWSETMGSGQAVNITMSLASTAKAPDNYNWVEDMLSQLEDGALEGYDITIESIEPRLLNGEVVVYAEIVTQITDEMIDLMIEQGVYTEEQIENAGGRELLLSIPPTTQISITAKQGGYLYTCTGTYYDHEQKQMVLDTMAIVIGTAERQ